MLYVRVKKRKKKGIHKTLIVCFCGMKRKKEEGKKKGRKIETEKTFEKYIYIYIYIERER